MKRDKILSLWKHKIHDHNSTQSRLRHLLRKKIVMLFQWKQTRPFFIVVPNYCSDLSMEMNTSPQCAESVVELTNSADPQLLRCRWLVTALLHDLIDWQVATIIYLWLPTQLVKIGSAVLNHCGLSQSFPRLGSSWGWERAWFIRQAQLGRIFEVFTENFPCVTLQKGNTEVLSDCVRWFSLGN